MSGRAVEAAGDVDTLLLDKTGTITLGNRMATELHPAAAACGSRSWPTPRSSPSLADETPEGRSIVVLVKEKLRPARPRRRAAGRDTSSRSRAQTRMSGCDLDGRAIRKGAVDAVVALRRGAGRHGARTSSRRSPDGIGDTRRHAAGGRGRRARARASSTSRTWSRAASRSASRASAPWASAP